MAGRTETSICFAATRRADLRDSAVREQAAISSNELTELIKKIPALKQVMILDPCAAGTVCRTSDGETRSSVERDAVA